MESKSYYPANVDTQQYIIQYNFIKIKKMVKENNSKPHSSCLCHLLKPAHCHKGVKAEIL